MTPEDEPVIDGRPLSTLKVIELREELGKRGLSKIGNKNILCDRLKEFLSGKIQKREGENADEPSADDVLKQEGSPSANPFVAEYLAKQQAALREARKDADAVRRAASGDESSASEDKPTRILRRGRSSRRGTATDSESSEQSFSSPLVEKKFDIISKSDVEEASSIHSHETKEPRKEISPEAASFASKDDIGVVDNEEKEEPIVIIKGEEEQRTEVNDATADRSESPEAITPQQDNNDIQQNKNKSPEKNYDTNNEEETSETFFKNKKKYGDSKFDKRLIKGNDGNDGMKIGEFLQDETQEMSGGSPMKSEGSDSADEQLSSSDSPNSESDDADENNCVQNNDERSNTSDSADDIIREADTQLSVSSDIKSAKNMEDIVENKIKNEKSEENSANRKRRWKGTSVVDDTTITVSVPATKENSNDFFISHELDIDNTEKRISDMDEDTTEDKEKLEELDYEEAVHLGEETDNHYKVDETKAVNEKTSVREVQSKSRDRRAKEEHDRSQRQSSKDRSSRKEEKITEDGFIRRRSLSPSRYPTSNVIIIRQLTRPFTVKQLQQLLSKFGQIAENGFWIDNIKSMCIVKYSSVEEAVIARGRLHNVVWPSCSPRMLKVDYTDELRLKRHIEGDKRTEGKDKKDPTHETKETIDGSNAPNLRISVNVDVDQSKRQLHVSSSTREKSSKEVDKELKNRDHDRERRRRRASDSPRHVDEKRVRRSSPWRDEHRGRRPVEGQNKEPEKRLKTADELYQKTKTQPAIYFLPLTDDQILERIKHKEMEANLTKKQAVSSAGDKRKEKDENPNVRKEKTSSRHTANSPARNIRGRSPVLARAHRSSRSRSPRRRR